jgi:hypothetical protein
VAHGGFLWVVLGRVFGILVDWPGWPVLGQVDEILVGRGRGESAGSASSFPGQPEVLDEVAGEPELGVGGEDQPGPAVGLFGGDVCLTLRYKIAFY